VATRRGCRAPPLSLRKRLGKLSPASSSGRSGRNLLGNLALAKETLFTTGLVLALSAVAAIFFLVADQLIQLVMRFVFKIG